MFFLRTSSALPGPVASPTSSVEINVPVDVLIKYRNAAERSNYNVELCAFRVTYRNVNFTLDEGMCPEML